MAKFKPIKDSNNYHGYGFSKDCALVWDGNVLKDKKGRKVTMKTKSGKKRKVWVGWTWKTWMVASGFSGYDFVLCDVQKEKIEPHMKKIRITVEEL